MENKIDFEGLSSFLLFRIRDIVAQWLPGGTLAGHEYSCGDLRGGQGKSFRVNINTGKWADFAADIKGGDLISLYAAIHSVTQLEAYQRLSSEFNYTPGGIPANVSRGTSVEQGILPPVDTPPCSFHHPKHGSPHDVWKYSDAQGRTAFYVARYDTPEGKEFVPKTWNGQSWQSRAWPAPRPLYGVEFLTLDGNLTKPIMVVEGEKSADAARKLTQAYIVVTWSGGSKAYSKTDWTPLAGRKVLIWPDADEPGVQAAQAIAGILGGICQEVKVLDVSPRDQAIPQGWDAADAVQDGMTWAQFVSWAKPRAQVINVQVNNTQVNITQAEPEAMPTEPQYALYERLGIACAQNGSPICNEDNVSRVFEGEMDLGARIWFDDFYSSVFIEDAKTGPREIKALDIYKLTMHLQRKYGMSRMNDSVVKRALMIIADRVHKNEPKDWMEHLTWDRKPRIEAFMTTHMGAKSSPYAQAASKNFWISMAARIYWPGCIMRSMVILKSKQLAGKSTAFSIIGGKWYSEALENIQSNNFLQSLHGNLLVEFGDLAGMDRAEVNRIKQIISCRKDRFRAPYEPTPADHLRQCVLVGSTNEGSFLRDDTGGTRFWPIETGTINHAMIVDDRDQLFAEAVYRFKDSENWHIMPVDETHEVQESYRQGDEWESIILEYLNSSIMLNREITVALIAKDALHIPVDRLDKSTQMRIARNLSVIGFEKYNKRVGSQVLKLWRSKDVATDEAIYF